jgi:uncharacterized membrane protein
LNRKSIAKILSVLLCALGSIPFLHFFSTVDQGTPIFVLFIGVGMISVSGLLSILTVEDDSNNLHFIFFLYFSTLLFFTMFRIRFNNLSYGDILAEFRSARNTLEQGVWLIQRSQWERYFSSISVSLTPSIVSQISGLDLLVLFQYGYRIIAAILPIALYYLVKEVFENSKVSAISAVLFAQLYFNEKKLMNLTRQQVSEIFFILFLFLLFRYAFKNRMNKKSYFISMFIFIFSFVSSHYVINYFSIAILGAMFFVSLVLPHLPKNFMKTIKLRIPHPHSKGLVTKQILLLLLVFSLLWWSTVQLTNFQRDISQEINNMFFRTPYSQAYYQVGFIQGSPLGSIVTGWVDITAAMAAIGFLYILFRERKTEKMAYWLVASAIMFGAMALWLTPTQSATGAYPDRIYIIGFIFFSSFCGYVLHSFGKYRFLKVLFFVFILLNLSMNMFLPVYSEYVHYNQETLDLSEKNVVRETVHDAEFTLQLWMNQHVPTTETVVTHFFGGINVFYLHCESKESNEMLLNETYVILDHIIFLSGLWRSGELDSEVVNITAITNQSCVVYNSGRVALISPRE